MDGEVPTRPSRWRFAANRPGTSGPARASASDRFGVGELAGPTTGANPDLGSPAPRSGEQQLRRALGDGECQRCRGRRTPDNRRGPAEECLITRAPYHGATAWSRRTDRRVASGRRATPRRVRRCPALTGARYVPESGGRSLSFIDSAGPGCRRSCQEVPTVERIVSVLG